MWRLGALSLLANPLRLGLPVVREVALPGQGARTSRMREGSSARRLRISFGANIRSVPPRTHRSTIFAAYPEPPRNDLEDGVLVEPVFAKLVAVVQVDNDAAELGLREENTRLTRPAGLDGGDASAPPRPRYHPIP